MITQLIKGILEETFPTHQKGTVARLAATAKFVDEKQLHCTVEHEARLARLTAETSTLFPVERDYASLLKASCEALANEISRIVTKNAASTQWNNLCKKYQKLDLEGLRARKMIRLSDLHRGSRDQRHWHKDEEKQEILLPVFALVSLTSSNPAMKLQCYNEKRYAHGPPEALRGSCWVYDQPGLSWHATYETRFSGKVPQATREKIRSVLRTNDFTGDNIFLIYEAQWHPVAVPDPDPIVAGWDGKNLWIIDVFDLTPVERALACLSKQDDETRV